jgi:hypothetical protein
LIKSFIFDIKCTSFNTEFDDNNNNGLNYLKNSLIDDISRIYLELSNRVTPPATGRPMTSSGFSGRAKKTRKINGLTNICPRPAICRLRAFGPARLLKTFNLKYYTKKYLPTCVWQYWLRTYKCVCSPIVPLFFRFDIWVFFIWYDIFLCIWDSFDLGC